MHFSLDVEGGQREVLWGSGKKTPVIKYFNKGKRTNDTLISFQMIKSI